MVVPTWPTRAVVADHHGGHGESEYQTCGGHDLAGAAHRPDDARLQPGAYLLFEPCDQEQVVVGSHRQQDDD